MDAEDGRAERLIGGAQKLSSVVNYMQFQQTAWNEDLKRHYVVEEQQRAATQQLLDIAKADSVDSMMNENFVSWLAQREPQADGVTEAVAAVGERRDSFNEDWFHQEDLADRTGFTAVIPYPRGLTKDSEASVASTIDELGLSAFYVQSVPLHLPIRELSRAFVRSPAHLTSAQQVSKSDRGTTFDYVSSPCKTGRDAVELVHTSATLRQAVHELPCLWISTTPTLVTLCARCYVVQGRCGAVEVACDQRWVGLLCAVRGVCAVSNAIQHYLHTFLSECLPGDRSWCVTLLGDMLKSDTAADGAAGAVLTNADFRFRLLGIERADPARFELFDTDELSTIGGYMKRRLTNTGASLPPAVRYTHLSEDVAPADGIAKLLAGFPGNEVTRELQQSERAYRLQPGPAHPAAPAAGDKAASLSAGECRRDSYADPQASAEPTM